jgi:hypothetical protein
MARQRPPTDELKTAIYDSQQRARAKSPTKKGFESGQHTLPEIGTPTQIDPPRKERSEPIRVISMKKPDPAAKPKGEAKQHNVAFRAMSDVGGQKSTPPRGMGYLAPPVNQKERNVRKLRDWLIWGSVLVIISCIVMLAVWFLAGR